MTTLKANESETITNYHFVEPKPMKKLALLFTLVTTLILLPNLYKSQTCANESFTNLGPYGGYQTETWTGDDGIGWTATDARTDQTINGKAICFRGTLTSGTFSGGIGDLTVTTQRKFSGGTGNLDLKVNGVSVGSIPYDATVQTTTISGINVTGNVVIELVNGTTDRVAVDDLTWTCYAITVPTIQPGTLNSFGTSTCIGTTAGPESFSLSGALLDGTDVTITSPAPAGVYTFSTNSGGPYTNSLTLTAYDGTSPGTIYVEFTPAAAISYDGNITLSGGGDADGATVAATASGSSGTPAVTTTTATSITASSAQSGGTSISAGCCTITNKGVVWGTSANPTYPASSKTDEGTGTANYTSSMTGLSSNTTYYYRAYAVNCNGVVSYGTEYTFTTLKGEPTNHPTVFACATTTDTQMPLTWTDAIGATTPDGYLIKWSTTSYAAITAPTDGTAEADGATTQNITQGTQGFTATGLTANTTYYFKIWSYTNSGTDIDYKTNGTIQQTSCTTQNSPCFSDDFQTESGGSLSNFIASGGASNGSSTNQSGDIAALLNTNGEYLQLPTSYVYTAVSYTLKGSVNLTNSWTLHIQYSTDNGSTWNDASVINGTDVTNSFTLGSASIPTPTCYVRFYLVRTGNSCYLGEVSGFCDPAPEADIFGNAVEITDGDTTPSTTDDTDYGNVDVAAGGVTHTFTIENNGTDVLNISSITITGADAADFTLGGISLPTTVAASSSTTFTVTFDPTVIGAKVATVTVNTDDCSEAAYDYAIQGNAIAVPDIVLSSSNPAVAAGNIEQGTTDNVIYAFQLDVTTFDAVLTSFDLITQAGYAASNVDNLHAYYSTDAIFDGGDALLDSEPSASSGPGTHTFNGFSQTIAMNATGYFFITADLPCNATAGNTITVTAITTADLTFTSGNKTGTAYDGGTQTIISHTPTNVTGASTTICQNNGSTITWTLPTDCYDQIYVVATDGSYTAATPTGNGSGFTADANYGGGDNIVDASYLVYSGTGTSVAVTGLTNGTTYTFKIFTRNDTQWSSGVTVTCTPTLTYCDPGSWSSGDSEIENVTLVGENNTISEVTTDICTNTIQDNTGISADLGQGASYTLTVEFGDCNNGTQYDGAGGVWIDWNQDGDFYDAGEQIWTGDVAVGSGNVIQNITINVAGGQAVGNYTMRIVQDESGSAGTIDPCTSPGWGTIVDYTVEVITLCTPVHTVTGFAPTTGPSGTAVTITGTGFTTSTTAEVDGIAATVQFLSTTSIIVEIPSGATTNTIDITESGCAVHTASDFTIISTAGICGGSTSFTDLIISEVYDSDANNVWYIELFNPTNSDIDLGAENYTIERYATAGDASPTRTITLSGIVPAGGVFLINIGTSANTCTESWDFTSSGAGINADDGIMLVHNGTDADWVECPNNTGYSILRDVTATGPTTTWNAADWTTNNTEGCSDLGNFSVVYDTHPTVTNQPDDLFACSILEGVAASAGSGGGALTYQWLYNDGSSASWSNVTAAAFPLATVTGETTINLSITGAPTDIEAYDGYQFYCLVTESGACTTASDAAQFRARSENDPEMITAMINSCNTSCGTEGYNEFLALEIGDTDIDVTSPNIDIKYNVTYPATTGYTDSYTADATLTGQFNTAAGCGSPLFIDAVGAGTIPANSIVLVMSSNTCADAYDFTGLCGSGPIYLLYSTDGNWGSTGNFANTGAGSRYFSVTFTDVNGLVTTTEYDYDPSNFTDTDGEYAEFEYCSSPAYNYGNDGCSVRSTTLPVEMLYFEAYKRENTVLLDWETASEINNDKFVVMRSTSGEVYQPIGEVKGQGNSSVINRYTFIDQHPRTGDNFYAIYQYDYNGSMTKSDIRLVEFNLDEDFTPISIDNLLQINYRNMPLNAYFEIYTIEGKLVAQERVADLDGIITLDLPTEQQYLIRLISNNNSVVKKIVH